MSELFVNIQRSKRGNEVVCNSILESCSDIMDLCRAMELAEEKGVSVRFTQQQWFTSSSWRTYLRPLTLMHREFTSMNSAKSLARIKERGMKLGRPSGISAANEKAMVKAVKVMSEEPKPKLKDVLTKYKLNTSTWYRYAEHYGWKNKTNEKI